MYVQGVVHSVLAGMHYATTVTQFTAIKQQTTALLHAYTFTIRWNKAITHPCLICLLYQETRKFREILFRFNAGKENVLVQDVRPRKSGRERGRERRECLKRKMEYGIWTLILKVNCGIIYAACKSWELFNSIKRLK